MRLSEDYAIRARTELDIDDPSVDCLQALLLLAVAFTAGGKGKKAHMMLGTSTMVRGREDTDKNQQAELEWQWPSNCIENSTSRLG